MGWLFPYGMNTKGEMKASIIRDLEHNTPKMKVLRQTIRGNALWVQVEFLPTGRTEVERTILLYLLQKHEGSWGYKDMCESDHPVLLTCPLSYLEDLTEPRGLAQGWRDSVRESYAQKGRIKAWVERAKVGDAVPLIDFGSEMAGTPIKSGYWEFAFKEAGSTLVGKSKRTGELCRFKYEYLDI